MAAKRKVRLPSPMAPSLLATMQPRRSGRRGRTGHYASSMAFCPRREYYDWVQAPLTNPPTAGQLAKMEAGKLAEEIAILRLSRQNELIDQQRVVSLQPDGLAYAIHGKGDVVVGVPLTDGTARIVAVEVKSTEYSGTQRVMEAPRIRDLCQLWVYMRADTGAQEYRLLYLDRGNHRGAEYGILEVDGQLCYYRVADDSRLAVDGEADEAPFAGVVKGDVVMTGLNWGMIVAKLQEIEQAVGSRTPPDRYDALQDERYEAFVSPDEPVVQGSMTFNLAAGVAEVRTSHWMCMGYCGYRDHCWLGTGAPSKEARAILAASRKLMLVNRSKVKQREVPLIELPDGKVSFNPDNVPRAPKAGKGGK